MANANGHGGKRAGAGRPSTVPHPTHGGKREGAGRTPGVCASALARTEVGLRRRLFQFILDCQIEQRSRHALGF